MIIPYFSFNGKCAEAIAFYEKIFNTKASVMRYSDAPKDEEFQIEKNMLNWVMHASMDIAGSKIYLCDSPDETEFGSGIIPHIIYDTTEEASAVFELLKEGGIVVMDIAPQFYAKAYGCVCDKFGVNWAVMCE